MSTFKDKIKSRPERSVTICLDPATYAQWEAVDADLRAARQRDQGVNDSTEVRTLAERVRALEDAMHASEVEFRFRALTRHEWADLIARHKPRTDNQLDKMLGYDADAVTTEAARRCLVAPDLDDDDWAALDDTLSHGQWELVKNVVLAVNAGKVDVPFSPLASRLTADSDGKSKPPSRSASPSSGGTGGNRRR